MDKDLKRVVDETIQELFKDAPEKLIERGVREIQYDICPHCKQEIYEKHEYTEDGGITWRHSECKGLISRPETPVEQIADWLKPYVKEARQVRKLARKQMGLKEDLMPMVQDKDDMDSIKKLGSGGFPQGGPSSGDEDNETRVDNALNENAGPFMRLLKAMPSSFGSGVKVDGNKLFIKSGEVPVMYVEFDPTSGTYTLIKQRQDGPRLISDPPKSFRDENDLIKYFTIKENVAGLPPSGEEKYNKQEPGGGKLGTMNMTTIATEKVERSEDTQVLNSFGDSAEFHNSRVKVLNATKQTLGVTVQEFTATTADGTPQSAYLITIA